MEVRSQDDDPSTDALNLDHLTYEPRHLKGTTIDHDDLERHCPLDVGRHDPLLKDGSFKNAGPSMGILNKLPVELLHTVLLDLDLRSLIALRVVNRCVRLAVDALPHFNVIVTHTPNALRALLSVGLAHTFTCRTLYDTICSSTCVGCGDFGSFLYLLTCSRICFLCMIDEERFQPLTRAHAKAKFALDNRTLSSIPFLRTLPGIYSQWEKGQSFMDRVKPWRALSRDRRLHFEKTTSENYSSIYRIRVALRLRDYVDLLALRIRTISTREAAIPSASWGPSAYPGYSRLRAF
ncbi:MAG: hypothetical protein M1817_006578 [Caeruleum heppii]|nr:MAG: hypothetical protein M1817_006578 [Caeruleum heppii]